MIFLEAAFCGFFLAAGVVVKFLVNGVVRMLGVIRAVRFEVGSLAVVL